MANKRTLDRDLIIHPGETLEELLVDRGMSQRDLANRCGVTEKHISSVIAGKSNITASFAKKLEYVFGVEARFWLNLQNIYDEELLDFEESNNILPKEIEISKKFKEVCTFAGKYELFPPCSNEVDTVIALRKFLGVTDLLKVPEVSYNAAYRADTSTTIDEYVLFGWQMFCERLMEKREVNNNLNLDRLQAEIPFIKSLMKENAEVMRNKLREVLASCGIAFEIVPYFKKAPVQGFIKQGKEKIVLCMTIRRQYVDIFWFTFFHEIGHLLSDDIKRQFIDFETKENERERKADRFAADTLINRKAYKIFTEKRDYSARAINSFAKDNNVIADIVYGRLAKDGYLEWKDVARREKFSWR